MTSALLTAALTLTLAQSARPSATSTASSNAASPAAGSIERARALYDNASYEEALSLLITIENEQNQAEVEQYRALCLLALGREPEALRALERIVVREPRYRMDVGEISPRLVLMFRDVRQRLLPAVARNLYARAKGNYDARRYPLATAQLHELIALLSEDEPATLADGLPELRQLAEGFLSLSAAASEPPSTPAPTPPLATPPDPKRIYTTQDRAVMPPVEVMRRVPNAVEIGPQDSPRLYQGLVEVVIDETGRVQAAHVRRSVTPRYDAALIESTREWRFQPATVNGTPVPYRKYFEVIVWGLSQRRTFGTKTQ